MISSEVQRTLVKSPPELWAELGDPTSLARHLGELGEIRITRAEPEKLVEWEAESAKGTVAMKGSGWGTKVTLTASRELSPPQPAPTPEDEPAIHDQPSSGDEEPLASGLDVWSRQQAEVLVTAAERFGHEHSATLLGTDLQRAADREPPAEPDGGEASLDPIAGVEEHAAEPASVELQAPITSEAEPEPESESEADPSTDAPAPRRGLFARLFGRRRSSAPAASSSSSEPPSSVEAATTIEGSHDTAALLADALPAASDTPATVSAVPDALPMATDAGTETAAASEQESRTAESMETDEATDHAAEPAVAVAVEIEVDEVQAPAEADPSIDLAAELRAAEEEVEAILTGVLDRLGAAHHRPFSRS